MKRALIQDLGQDEGCVLHAYQDHLGYWTIGIGRLIDKRRGGGITRGEAEYLLGNDVDEVFSALDQRLPEWRDWPEPVQRAVANMAFQMGPAGFMKFKRTIRLLRDGKWDEAADNALKSKWARQTPNRAKRVTDLMRSARR